jgi:hypothetical protein
MLLYYRETVYSAHLVYIALTEIVELTDTFRAHIIQHNLYIHLR